MAPHPVAASIRLPHPSYLWKVIRRSVGIWLLVRSCYAVVLIFGMASFDFPPYGEAVAQVLHPAWATRALLVALAAVLVWWDRKRFHELLLPANLGAWSGWFWMSSLLAASMSDVAVQALVAAL